MKRFSVKHTALLLIFSVLLSAGAGCGKGNRSEKAIVGILKIVSHPVLDAVEKGILDELNEEGYSNITFDLQNAEGNMNEVAAIAQKFRAEQVKIAVGIATPCAQALRNNLKDSVVIYTAVTDPVDAGLVKSLAAGEKKVAGVSDMIPVKDQIELLKKIKDIKRLGYIYSNSEFKSAALLKMVRKACYALEIELVEATVTKPSEVRRAAESVAGRVDAFYLGTDNIVAAAIGAVVDAADKNKIPVMTAEPGSAEKSGVLAAWGLDYYKTGRMTGKLVARILSGERPENIPAIFMTEPSDVDLLLNLDTAKKLGLTVSEKLISQAETVIRDGKIEKK